MKKKLMRLAAVLCYWVTITVLAACNDDDATSPVAGPYQYFVEFDKTSSYEYNSAEASMLRNALNKAVGLNGQTYEKTYFSNQDSQMKTACEAVLAQYPDLESLLLSFNLYGNDGVAGQALVVANLKAGKSLKTPYAIMLLDTKYNLNAMKVVRDSLYSLKTASDSAMVERLRERTNDFRTEIYLDIKDAIKDVNEVWKLDEDLDGYDQTFFSQIADAVQEPDSLFYDFSILVTKVRLPEVERSMVWEKNYKAYYNK
jgi:hypothetical protein